MSETLSSSVWPSRHASSDPLWPSLNTPQSSVDDYPHIWNPALRHSAEECIFEDDRKDDFIKSIWSIGQGALSSSSHDNNNNKAVVNDNVKNIDQNTPTNSPSLKRTEIVNCNERWGNVQINQITPWNVIDLDESEKLPHDPMVWRAKIDGTEVWEDYYLKQHGRRRPQAENTFNSDNVWSSASEISQSTSSLWSPKVNDASTPSSDIYPQNMFSDINNRPTFNTTNGIRPSMTRNQAQKYLIDMGYSLSDAIGALVNNQMDLPKAINELQSKYRMSTNCQTLPNGMYTPTPSFNNRTGENVNMSRIPPGTPLNSIVGQNNSASPMLSSNFNSSFDMFQSDSNDQLLESQYMNMDPNMSQFGRILDNKRQNSMSMNRDNLFRNTFPNGAMNNRSMSNNSGQFPDMSALSQGMNRMNINFNQGHVMMSQNNASFNNNKWSNNSNGFNGMHNSNNNANNLMLNNNSNFDMRPSFTPAMSGGYGRSISKQQQMYPRNTSWLSDNSSISPNGALNDINQVRLAKNMSYPGGQENAMSIIIKKVPLQHIDLVKSICYESGAMTNFQLLPQMQAIIVHFNSGMEARRCVNMIHSQMNVRVEFISDEYMPGATCQP